jgi:hypothetical protein
MWASSRFDATRIPKTSSIALTDDQMRRHAPSIFAETPWERMTEKYLFVPTIHVVNQMRANGFMPVRAMQSRSRIEGKSAYTKHMVVFRDVSKELNVGDTVPEVVLVNSHDGTSSYQLHSGIFRLVCANGLIVADSTLDSIKCRHAKNVIHDIIEGTNTLIKELPVVAEQLDLFKSITLSPADQVHLAQASLFLRYDESDHAPIEPRQLLEVRRKADSEPTLWNTFNRIEENMMKGGLHGHTSTNKRTTTRAVKGVSENVRLEKALWHLANFMGKNLR